MSPPASGVRTSVAFIVALLALAFGSVAGVAVGGAAGFFLGRELAENRNVQPDVDPELTRLEAENRRLEGEIEGLEVRLQEAIDDAIELAVPTLPPSTAPESGFLDRPFLGVEVRPYDPDADPTAGDYTEGAVVASVLDGSGAAAAGIEAGDLIVAFDGDPIADPEGLIEAVATRAVGDTVTIMVVRNDETLEVDVTLGARPLVAPVPEGTSAPEPLSARFGGLPARRPA